MINTRRLFIRGLRPEDGEEFFELTKDDGFNLFPIKIYRQKDLKSALEWIQVNKNKFGVWEKATGALVGIGGLTPWVHADEEMIDITYRLREAAWGKGYGIELAQGLVTYGFNELGLTEITATITPDNVASKKIAEKLGMRFEKEILLLGLRTELYRLIR